MEERLSTEDRNKLNSYINLISKGPNTKRMFLTIHGPGSTVFYEELINYLESLGLKIFRTMKRPIVVDGIDVYCNDEFARSRHDIYDIDWYTSGDTVFTKERKKVRMNKHLILNVIHDDYNMSSYEKREIRIHVN